MKPLIKPKIGSLMGVMLGVVLLLEALGCAGRPAATPMQMAAEPPAKDVLAPGDVIEIKFTYTPELNDSQTISPDGTITLPLIREVKAQGKTRSELRDELYKLYSPLLKRPDYTIIAKKQIQRRVYVAGEVIRPGAIEMPWRMTALQALMEAGGPDMKTGTTKHVLVIRQSHGEEYGCALDLSDALAGKASKPLYLEPLDIVYVPRSGISKVNQWIDQYINKMVPQTGATVFYPIGPGGLGRLGIDTSQSRQTPR